MVEDPYEPPPFASPSVNRHTLHGSRTRVSSSETATGWTLGGGFEYALWQKWTLKAEYLYVSLNSSLTETALTLFPGVTAAPASFNANFSRTINVARLGLNYHF